MSKKGLFFVKLYKVSAGNQDENEFLRQYESLKYKMRLLAVIPHLFLSTLAI